MQILFYLPAVLFIVSGLPQMVKLLRTKSSEDISVWMYFLTCIAIAIVVLDAYLSHNASIFVSNLASLAITGTNTILILKYRKKAPVGAENRPNLAKSMKSGATNNRRVSF